MLSVVFLGSGAFACPILQSLLDAPGVSLRAAVTQPDRPSGRGKRPAPCPAKALAQARGLPVLCPPDVNDPGFLASLRDPSPPDFLVVADYAQFLRPPLLALPRFAPLNVHPSLLPKYRGAAPLQWTLANGDPLAGVTILGVTPRMDAGSIYAQASAPVLPRETCPSLSARLAAIAAPLLLETLRAIAAGTATPVPQDETRVTFARLLGKADGFVDWTLPAAAIENRIRAFSPWPGASTALPDSTRIKLLEAAPLPPPPGADPAPPPGTVLPATTGELLVATGGGVLRILALQPAGGRPMPAADYLRGHPLPPGTRLAAPPLPPDERPRT